MRGDRLTRMNTALNTLARETLGGESDNYEGYSPAVLKAAEDAGKLTLDEQLGLFAEVAEDITKKTDRILECFPSGEVDCSLGNYTLRKDGNKIRISHRQTDGFRSPSLAGAVFEEGMTEAVMRNGAPYVELVESLIPTGWHTLFDTQETIGAIHAAAAAGTPETTLGSVPRL